MNDPSASDALRDRLRASIPLTDEEIADVLRRERRARAECSDRDEPLRWITGVVLAVSLLLAIFFFVTTRDPIGLVTMVLAVIIVWIAFRLGDRPQDRLSAASLGNGAPDLSVEDLTAVAKSVAAAPLARYHEILGRVAVERANLQIELHALDERRELDAEWSMQASTLRLRGRMVERLAELDGEVRAADAAVEALRARLDEFGCAGELARELEALGSAASVSRQVAHRGPGRTEMNLALVEDAREATSALQALCRRRESAQRRRRERV